MGDHRATETGLPEDLVATFGTDARSVATEEVDRRFTAARRCWSEQHADEPCAWIVTEADETLFAVPLSGMRVRIWDPIDRWWC